MTELNQLTVSHSDYTKSIIDQNYFEFHKPTSPVGLRSSYDASHLPKKRRKNGLKTIGGGRGSDLRSSTGPEVAE